MAAGAAPPAKKTIKFTRTGLAYLEDDDEAANEHKLERLPFSTPLDEIEHRYGIGTRLYFDFLKYIIFCNVVLFAVGFLNWVVFMASDDAERTVMCNYPNQNFSYREGCNCTTPIVCPTYEGATRPLQLWEKAFVNAFTKDQLPSWATFSALAVVLWFAFGPLYLVLVRKTHKIVVDHDNEYDMSGEEADRITANETISSVERIVRRTISYVVFCLLIAGSAAGIYFIQAWGTKAYVQTSFWLSLLVTVIISGVNMAWSFICSFLVSFEKHCTWSAHRKHHTIKLYAFKIINVTVMYAALQWAFSGDYACPLQDIGVKFLLLIVMDLFIMNAVEFFLPVARTVVFRRISFLRSKGSDESELPDFDVAEEYLELLYRQFVLYMGMLTLPLLTFVALITNIVEYPLDKFRMLRMCQRPKRLNSSLTGFIVVFMVITAAAGFFSYPHGALWMFLHLGRPGEMCSLWTMKPSDLP